MGKLFLLPSPAHCLRLRFRCFLVPGSWHLIHAADVSCSPGFVCLFLVTVTVLAVVTFTFTFIRSGMFMVMVPRFWLRYIHHRYILLPCLWPWSGTRSGPARGPLVMVTFLHPCIALYVHPVAHTFYVTYIHAHLSTYLTR